MTTAKNKVRKPLTAKRLVGAGVWGAAMTLLAYLLSFGSVPAFIVLMFVISAVLRVMAVAVLRQRGEKPPQGWWL
jgi:drug/metabolite transporter (DMT)-like permease